jgi:hypothetical protein
LVVPFVELRGRVRDPAGDPVADAQLEFSRAGSGKPAVVAADSEGEFHVSNFQSGSYDVRISSPGFRPREERGVEIKPSAKPVNLSFELRK